MKVEKIWYVMFWGFIASGVLAIVTVLVLVTLEEPAPNWSIIQSEVSGFCYEAYKGKILVSPVSCP